jgi:hypothetical protein
VSLSRRNFSSWRRKSVYPDYIPEDARILPGGETDYPEPELSLLFSFSVDFLPV